MGAVAIERPTKTARINKQRVREGVATAVRLSQQVFTALQQKRVLISMGLILLLVLSSLGVHCSIPCRSCRSNVTIISVSGVNCCWNKVR